MEKIFIYTPRSGSRVFRGGDSTTGLVIDRLSNCSYQVQYDSRNWTLLVYEAAQPRNHYRMKLKDLINQSPNNTIPLAWDMQGEISLLVSRYQAEWLDEIVSRLSKKPHKAQLGLLLAGETWPDCPPPLDYIKIDSYNADLACQEAVDECIEEYVEEANN